MHLHLCLSVVCLNLAGTVAAGEPGGKNLVANSDFEKAGAKPGTFAAWSPPDGITGTPAKAGHPGQCLCLDTSVLQVDKKKFTEAAAGAKEAPKGKSKGGQYDTVGAHEGAWLFSAPIEVAKDAQYFILEADVKGPERSSALFYPQVFVRGYKRYDLARDGETSAYFQVPHPGGPAYTEQFGKEQRAAKVGDLLMVYRHSLVCRLEAADEWQHFKLGISLPKMAKYRPEVLLLKPYAMWPLGKYHFDNVVLRPATKAEFDAATREGHDIKGFMPTANE